VPPSNIAPARRDRITGCPEAILPVGTGLAVYCCVLRVHAAGTLGEYAFDAETRAQLGLRRRNKTELY
jgi:hypothetical protein